MQGLGQFVQWRTNIKYYDLSIGTMFNDLERPMTQVSTFKVTPVFGDEYIGNGSRLRHVYNGKTNRKSYAIYRILLFPMVLNDP